MLAVVVEVVEVVGVVELNNSSTNFHLNESQRECTLSELAVSVCCVSSWG
jgi:hypothetical protein